MAGYWQQYRLQIIIERHLRCPPKNRLSHCADAENPQIAHFVTEATKSADFRHTKQLPDSGRLKNSPNQWQLYRKPHVRGAL